MYGSYVKGSSQHNDIDLMVIFLEGSLKERLNKLQDIKLKIRKLNKKFDLKQILLKDLFSPEFFARTGILTEGISLKTNNNFCEMLGYNPFTLFEYSLKELNHTEKIKIGYIFSGRNGPGIIKDLNGKKIGRGVVKIPINKSLEFEEVLIQNNIKFNKKNILEEK